MQRFVRRGGSVPAAESRILKLKGLPYATKEGDLHDFFRDFKLVRVALVSEPDGRPSGLAFAEFESSEEAVRAMSARNGDYIGDRYVKLLRVPPEEMEEQTGMSSGMLGGHVPGGMPGAGSGFGMQPGFAMQPQPPGQMMQHRPNAWGQGNAAGEQGGFAQQQGQQSPGFGAAGQQQGGSGFGMAGQQQQQQQQPNFGFQGQGWSPMTAPQAFGGYNPTQPQQQQPQQSAGFNGHQQSLFPGNGLGGMPGGLGPWSGHEPDGGGHSLNLPQEDSQKPIAVLIAEQQAAIREAQRAVAASAAMPSYQQALGGPGGLPQGSLPQGSMPLPQGGLQQGGLQHGAMQQAALQQFAQHQGLPQGGLGMSMGGGHPATPPLGQGQSPPGAHGMAGHHPHGSSSFGSSGELPQRPQQRLVKTDGSTIKIRGLPFRAAREEILAFFDGYACLRDTLFLGTDGRGRPSGEGWLTFDTPEEALRCARERNRCCTLPLLWVCFDEVLHPAFDRQYLGSRYLEISLC